jgi:hypothetical protein
VKPSGIFNKLQEIEGFSTNVRKEKNIPHKIKRRKVKWIVHLRRNCLLKHITEGKIDGRSCGKRRKKT